MSIDARSNRAEANAREDEWNPSAHTPDQSKARRRSGEQAQAQPEHQEQGARRRRERFHTGTKWQQRADAAKSGNQRDRPEQGDDRSPEPGAAGVEGPAG